MNLFKITEVKQWKQVRKCKIFFKYESIYKYISFTTNIKNKQY